MSKVAKQFHYQVKSLNTGWARNQISPSTSIHTVSQQVILNFVESLLACVYPSCLPRTHDKLPFKLLSSLMPQPSFFSSILSYIFQLLRGLRIWPLLSGRWHHCHASVPPLPHPKTESQWTWSLSSLCIFSLSQTSQCCAVCCLMSENSYFLFFLVLLLFFSKRQIWYHLLYHAFLKVVVFHNFCCLCMIVRKSSV